MIWLAGKVTIFYITAGTLSVVSVDVTNKSTSLFTISGNQGPSWRQAFVTIGDGTTSDYVIQLIATLDKIITSDISIDDIQTSIGACNASTLPPKSKLLYNNT